MAAKPKGENDALLKTLQTLLIVQLAQADVPGGSIRRIAGVGMNRVTHVVKSLKKKGKRKKRSNRIEELLEKILKAGAKSK